MKTFKSVISRWAFIAIGGMASPLAAMAAEESVGKKTARLENEVSSIVSFLLTCAQAAAFFFLWSGISKIKKDKEQPGQGLMGQGLMACVIAVALYMLPRLMGMGEATIFP
jgi:hypothetical protein